MGFNSGFKGLTNRHFRVSEFLFTAVDLWEIFAYTQKKVIKVLSYTFIINIIQGKVVSGDGTKEYCNEIH